ncbi:hypothetical protein LPJ81_001092 [Coemansia sp. IMI 209127]|nr:hypothetical protein LPJ81_001092 [Coemansia sp. IMI 209127]
MPQTTDPPAEERILAHLPPQGTLGVVDPDRNTPQQQTHSRVFPQESTLGSQHRRVRGDSTGLYVDHNNDQQQSGTAKTTSTVAAAAAPSISNLTTTDRGGFINSDHQPASADRTEGAKRPRGEHIQNSTHSHAFLYSAQNTMAPEPFVAAHEPSVSVSPAPSSSAVTPSRDMHNSTSHTTLVPATPALPANSKPYMSSVVSAAPSHPVDTNRTATLAKDTLTSQNTQIRSVDSGEGSAHDVGSTHRTESDAANTDPSLRPDQTEDQDDDQGQDETNDNANSNRQSQKRRLNQACLLCRIQCIYPEVRKRGRPPRTYTFADFVLPGQPMPPELQSMSNVNASAMLMSPDHTGGQQRYGPTAGVTTPVQHGWRSSAPGAPSSSGHGHGHGLPSAEGDMSGTSTPAYGHNDYRHSSGLPPLSMAFGRSSGPAPYGYHHPPLRGVPDPMLQPLPPLAVDQAVLDLFEHVIPNFPIVHRHTVVQHIRDRSMPLPLWLAMHAVTARFETSHGGRPTHHHSHRNGSGSKYGAAYAEKAHAMLVSRFGQRQSRVSLPRNDRMRMAAPRGLAREFDEVDGNLPQREVVELLQSLILLSIYYSGNWEFELAVETHAAAVRIAQRTGVHLLDDPAKLPEANGIFNKGAALNQRKRAQSPGPVLSGSAAESSTRWNAPGPPPLPGGPNDVEMRDMSDIHLNKSNQASTSVSADLRLSQIEFETLRRLWWSMFILDRMYNMCVGVPRIIPISGFRVRLPCSDLEWDSIHAQPAAASPTATAMAAAADSNQSSRLMVRTFREAVMHTSLTEQAGNEIAATPSRDPEVFRYFAAFAGLIDSVVDLGDDIRALASPSMAEGTDILTQLRIEKRAADQADEASSYGAVYGRYGSFLHEGGHASADPGMKLPSTATWLGSQRARKQFSRTCHTGWISGSTSAAWPPDWRSRMRVLQERVAALEAQFTEWYSLMPIAQYVRKPYLYSQLPLQDRITYFHQQIVYYGSVIQLQSLVLMAQGLLLPDTVDDSAAAPALAPIGSPDYDSCFGPSALTDMLWRSLLDMELGQRHNAGSQGQRPQNDVVSDPAYSSRRRQFGSLSSWAARRPYRAAMDGAQGEGHGHGDDSANDDSMAFVPLDESGNNPEIVREELQRMVQAAWRRCTEAALAMSTAVKRATEVHRVASANPRMSYYDPTFRPQVLPPYRGDVVSDDRANPENSESRSPFAAVSSRFGPIPAVSEAKMEPHQHHLSTGLPAHGYADGPRLPPIDRRESAGASGHLPYQQQQQQQPLAPHGNSPSALNAGRFVESALGPGQVIDDATLFMRYNMFTYSAAYTGAYIHMQNLKLVPRWEEAARGQSGAAAKANELRAVGNVGMGSSGDEQDLGILPPPMPPRLPSPPCTPDKAREGVKPLVKILESIVPYWRVSSHVARLRSMWRDIEGSELPTAPLASPPMRAPTHVHPPTAPVGSGTVSGQAIAPLHPMPMSSTDHGQWGHNQAPKVMSPPKLHPPHYPGQQPPPPPPPHIPHMSMFPPRP